MNPNLDELLLGKIQDAISSTIRDGGRVGVAFSGGVDSSLVAKVCHDMGFDLTLLTVGFDNSHDIWFARRINEVYGYPHKILSIRGGDCFRRTVKLVDAKLDTDNLSWHENAIAFYYVSQLAQDSGIDTVVTANGIDELFCGYDAYRRVIDGGVEKSRHRIYDLMGTKLENELAMLAAIGMIARSEFGVSLLHPLLSPGFVEFAKEISLDQKITGKDDMLRKHAIRKLATRCGVPVESCTGRKKAMQYGSRIHRELLGLRRKAYR